MKQYEALYDWPIREISRITDSPVAEDYCDALVEGGDTEFISIAEQIRGLSAELFAAKAAREHFSKWSELREKVCRFSEQFPNFPDLQPRKFNLHILLSEKISLAEFAIDGNIDIDPDLYEIRDLPAPVNYSSFFHENTRSPIDSLAVFSYHNGATFDADIFNAPAGPTFLYNILVALNKASEISEIASACLKQMTPQLKIEAVVAFVRLCMVAKGGVVVPPIQYNNPLAILDPSVFQVDHGYQQWNDIILVLSEYNSRKEILLKYLTLYHIFENLMIKLPIVELERQQGGRMFSMRDFSRLYSQVDGAEPKALKRLLVSALCMSAKPTETFEKVITKRWDDLITAGLGVELNNALLTLGLQKDKRPLEHTDVKAGSEFPGQMCDMIYRIRCAIVHNKETEFHLNTISLNNAFQTLISNFLIPSMEEICFGLIGSPNPKTWYQGRELLLYA